MSKNPQHISEVVLPFVRSAFNYNRNDASDDSAIDASYETSLEVNSNEKVHQAHQSFADENNIVNLVDKLVNFGVGINTPVPISDELTSFDDYHSAMNAVATASSQFNELPAHVRARFENDPGKFLDFFNNPNNADEASKLGFLVPKIPEPIINVNVVSPDPVGSSTPQSGVVPL